MIRSNEFERRLIWSWARCAPECTVQALAGFCRKFSFKEVPLGSSTESEVGEGWDERETVGDVLDYATVPVEVHGGRIEIESQQGKGSTLRITLPATQT